MTRPHVNKSIEELEDLFEGGQSNPKVLAQLMYELGFRKTKRSLSLLSRVATARAELASEDGDDSINDSRKRAGRDTSPNTNGAKPSTGNPDSEEDAEPVDDLQKPAVLTGIRPPGTTGLPDGWTRRLKQDQEVQRIDAEPPLDSFIPAIAALISEMRKSSGGFRRYELFKGEKTTEVNEASGTFVYVFQFGEDANILEGAPVQVEVRGGQYRGRLVSISQGRILIALDDDLGPQINQATLLVDETALLEALKDKLEDVRNGKIQLNRAFSDAAIGLAPPPEATDATHIPAIELPQERSLGEASDRAYRRALSQPLTYIWGPPGCGKTRTIGPIVQAAFEAGKRVLICSNTNRAVDQVLLSICEALTIEHPAMKEGLVLRLGRVALDRLENDYAAYVTLDGIVERLSKDLIARKDSIERELTPIQSRLAALGELLSKYEFLDLALRDGSQQEAALRKLKDQAARLKANLPGLQQKEAMLQQELAGDRRGGFLGLMRRHPTVINRDIINVQREIRVTTSELEALEIRKVDAVENLKGTLARIERLRDELGDTDRDGLKKERTDLDAKAEQLYQELREIESELQKLRDSAVARAKIVGATCTKCYLDISTIGQFDVVIVDEASMVLLPTVWFVSGLAKEKLIISGDFRQIPPIVSTNQQSIFEAIGSDVFTYAGLDDKSKDRMEMLDVQYRMHPSICRLVANSMYNGLLKTAEVRAQKSTQSFPSLFDNEIVVVDTSDLWPFESVNAFFSRFNLMHALLARNIAWHYGKSNSLLDETSFGICTPYAAQSKLTNLLLQGEGLEQVQVGTVHKFQGDERGTILLDIPESHGGRGLGQFVQGIPTESVGAKLLNVAATRAQNQLIIVANLTYLDLHLPSASLLREFLHQIQQNGLIVKSSDVLALRPIESDLQGLLGRVELDENAKVRGIFNTSTFETAFNEDLRAAEDSIVIFSGFITPTRVGKLGDLLRAKISQGVRVRCVTRPPQHNGSMREELGRQALDALEALGCVVDLRTRIHEKIIIIDKKVVWHGSLNALSHTHGTDESMTREVNAEFAVALAADISKLRFGSEKAIETFLDSENPRCPNCGSRTVYAEGRYGPYFWCESGDCDWKSNLSNIMRGGPKPQPVGRAGNSNTAALSNQGPPCPECGSSTRLRNGRYGPFYGCTTYPNCKGTIDARNGRPM